MKETSVISVSAYLDRVNKTLKGEKAKIIGELTNLQMYEGRSYLYFSIKDSADQSTVKCFMWKNDHRVSGLTLRDGLEVIVTAYPAVYKPNGSLSLQVEFVELVGEGALQLAYEQLKKKLETEGLFSELNKRALPDYPHRIGVITSKNGAVINDFLSNIGKFGYEILCVDSKVEGADAIKDLLNAIEILRKKDIDVLVIMRGGGSLESFLAFNNEALVRAVATFPVPVLTGIGHDKDVPLVSLASDKNVSTPTAVANLLNSTWTMALSSIQLSEQKIFSQFDSALRETAYMIENSHVSIERRFVELFETFRKAEQTLVQAIIQIELRLAHLHDICEQLNKEIFGGFEILSRRVEDRLSQYEKILQISSPERQLAQGYSIVTHKGKVVRRMTDVSSGERLEIVVSDGIIETHVI